MEICIIDDIDIDLDRSTIYDIVKEAFEQYYSDNCTVVFDDGYNHKEYCRFNLYIDFSPMWNGYVIRLYDKLLNKSEARTTTTTDKYDLFRGIAHIAYDLNDTDIKSMYPKTKIEPMSIEEVRHMIYDEFITDEAWNRYMKGENTMITRTEMLDRATKIKEVKFNPPATIVFWNDGTKTVVKSQDDEPFDPEKGLAMAIIKKHFACNKGYFNNLFKKYCGDFKAEEPKKELKPSERPKVFAETAEQYSEEVKKQKQIGDGYDDIHWEANKRGRK